MSDKNILEVYKKRKYNEFLIEKRAKIEALKNNDPFGKFVNEINKKYIDLARKNGDDLADDFEFACAYKFTDATEKAIEEVENAFKDKMDDRDRVIEEVTAQLMSIENYDQEMAIYKRYGIIDENGLIYDYKDKENN